LKGQGRDPDIFEAGYLDNGWIYYIGSNGALIGNCTWEIESSLDR